MNYKMKCTAENIVVMTTDKGNTITLIFQKEDNLDIEDIITDNLLTSYEQRIKNNFKQK